MNSPVFSGQIDPGLAHFPPWMLIFLAFLSLFIFCGNRNSRQRHTPSMAFWRHTPHRGDKYLQISLYLFLATHFGMAIISACGMGFQGTTLDAIDPLHVNAVSWALTGNFSTEIPEIRFYTYILGSFYKIFGPSLFLGNVVSVLAIFIACLGMLEIAHLLELECHPCLPVFLLALSPANLFWTTITLREPFEILFVVLSVYFFLRYHLKKERLSLLAALTFGIFLGALQHALKASLIIFLPLMILWPRESGRNSLRLLGAVILFCSMGILWKSAPFLFTGAPQALLMESPLDVLNSFRGKLVDLSVGSKANYGLLFTTDSLSGCIFSFIRILFYYLFTPFPSMIQSASDIYGFFGVIFRSILMFFSMTFIWLSNQNSRRYGLLLLTLYVLLTVVWAAGTTNYGTAMRHHLTQNWILILLGSAGFTCVHEFLTNLRKRS